MNRLAFFSLFAGSLIIGLIGLAELRFEVSKQAANGALRSMLSSNLQANASAYLEATQPAAESWFADAESHFTRYRALAVTAQHEVDPKQRAALQCQSLIELQAAVKARPRESIYLVHLADQLQLRTSNESCPEISGTSGVTSIVEYALQQDPTNMQVTYAAGLLYLQQGDVSRAYPLFKHFLAASTGASDAQINFLISLVHTKEDLLSIVPARFPRIAPISGILKHYHTNLFESLRQPLAQMQIEGIQASLADFKSGVLPRIYHLQRILSLMEVVASSEVRRELDNQLSLVYGGEGQQDLAGYFRLRAEMLDLEILRGALATDTHPLKGNLGQWGSDDIVYVDGFHQSIGFYLKPGQGVKIIELLTTAPKGELTPSALRLFVSENNENWVEFPGNFTIETFKIGTRRVVAMRIDSVPSDMPRYWKINYSLGARSNQFYNSFESLLRVYGN